MVATYSTEETMPQPSKIFRTILHPFCLPSFEGLARLREPVSQGTLRRSVSRHPTPCTRSRGRCRCPGCPCRGLSSSSGVAYEAVVRVEQGATEETDLGGT